MMAITSQQHDFAIRRHTSAMRGHKTATGRRESAIACPASATIRS